MWFPEHVVYFDSYESKYPYTADGVPKFGRRPGNFDPLLCAVVAAGATTTLRLGTAILIVPQRNPVVLAQEIVAVDHSCAGRFDFGIGIGWSSEEFAAIGVPWERRAARTDEYLAAMRTLWRDERCSFHGDFVSFDNVIAEPKPIQLPHPPVWVGGGRGAALRRAARAGDGWLGFGLAAQEIAGAMAELNAICAAEGRDPASVGRKIGLPAPPPGELAGYLEAAAAAGVSEVLLALAGSGTQLLDKMDAALQQTVAARAR